MLIKPIALTALLLGVWATLLPPPPAEAQTRRASHCIAIADSAPGLQYLHKASYAAPAPADSLRISYVGHAQFLLQTAGGLNMVTDYTGFIGNVDLIPDVVTMNHAHTTHWTPSPDPAIAHVLRGWGDGYGDAAKHWLDLGEVLVRNVPTDIRSPFGDGPEPNGNSIFIFEVGGLCVGHLGHLHHEPDPEDYAALGRLDVVMAAVDGGMTLDLPTMLKVIERLRSSVIIPMHWFSDWSLQEFLEEVPEGFDIVDRGENALTVSLRTLPSRPTVVVLRPSYLGFD